MSRKSETRRHCGFTLIEVITTIVVVAIAAAALLSVFTSTIRGSADPMIQQQAVSTAEAYMEEILLKAFIDPDGIGGETRPTFDDVQDYNGLTDVGARDQNDNAIAGLGAYTITVTVGGDSLNGIAPIDSLRIDISVNHAAIDPIVLAGYRTNY
jgi:MSHA pilin protein MshD